MDVLLLSRIQFGLNIAFHFFFPPLSIGLSLMLVIMEGRYLKTKDPKYKAMTRFWIKIFALIFAIGVATGLIQSFSFGTNWARFSRFAGDVFGSALAAEGIFAFFLEAGFLGVLLFGWNRVKPGVHYFATICVAVGAHFSAVWIIIANSWMQTPAGYRIVGEGEHMHAEITSFWEMVFNPSSMDRLLHVLIGCWMAGAFFVISVSAYYMLKNRHMEIARSMMKIGLVVAGITVVAQLFSGDHSARIVGKYQPEKLAAFEGIYKTREHTPISIWGWVDPENEKVYSLKIPSGLSWLMYRKAKPAVAGLDQFPKEDWANVAVVFQTYHIMIILWFVMLFCAIYAIYLWCRKKLEKRRWFLWILVFSVLFPEAALQAGWFSTEMGRQPWVIYHILRTKHGVSKVLHADQVIGSLIMFVLIFTLLFALFIFLLDRKIKHGPELGSEEDAKLYRNVYKQMERE